MESRCQAFDAGIAAALLMSIPTASVKRHVKLLWGRTWKRYPQKSSGGGICYWSQPPGGDQTRSRDTCFSECQKIWPTIHKTRPIRRYTIDCPDRTCNQKVNFTDIIVKDVLINGLVDDYIRRNTLGWEKLDDTDVKGTVNFLEAKEMSREALIKQTTAAGISTKKGEQSKQHSKVSCKNCKAEIERFTWNKRRQRMIECTLCISCRRKSNPLRHRESNTKKPEQGRFSRRSWADNHSCHITKTHETTFQSNTGHTTGTLTTKKTSYVGSLHLHRWGRVESRWIHASPNPATSTYHRWIRLLLSCVFRKTTLKWRNDSSHTTHRRLSTNALTNHCQELLHSTPRGPQSFP